MLEVITLLEEIQAQQGDKRRPDSQAHWMAVPGPTHSPQGKGSQEFALEQVFTHPTACAERAWGGQRPGPWQMGFLNNNAANEKCEGT